MAIVAGIDFGTQSVRVSLVDSHRGRLASVAAAYPVLRLEVDSDAAMQRHEDHVAGLITAMRGVLAEANIDGARIEALAVATTGSTVVPVDGNLQPLDCYYLWCDHRAHQEAREITAAAQHENLEALKWYGGVYSPEMALAKVLHWLRHNPEKRRRFVTALEHCDLIVAMLTGVKEPERVVRSKVVIDAANTVYIDYDVLELIRDFLNFGSKDKQIEVALKNFKKEYKMEDAVHVHSEKDNAVYIHPEPQEILIQSK